MLHKILLGRTHAIHMRHFRIMRALIIEHLTEQTGVSGIIFDQKNCLAQICTHLLGIHAGYGYASVIDPNSDADSGVLVVMAQLSAWMLFLAFGMERHVIRALARSLQHYPAGAFAVSPEARSAVLSLGSAVITTALRIALPVLGLLLLVDIAFALFGKLHGHLQMHLLAFPAKMLVALLMLTWIAAAFPRMLFESSSHAWIAAQKK